jgi:hypothetical protein
VRLKQIEQVLADQPVSDIVRVLSYRPEIFGRYFSDTLHELLQGPSEWNTGERELFAAFVSSRNKCAY